MSIVFLIRTLRFGGAERQLVLLSTGLAKKGHKVTICTFYPDCPLNNTLKEEKVNIVSLNKRGRWDIFQFLSKLVSFINKESPDLVVSYVGASNIIGSSLKAFFPQLVSVWGIRASEMVSGNDWFSSFYQFLEPLFSKFADLIIVNSHAGYQHAQKSGYPTNKMIVIPNGIETSIFKPNLYSRAIARGELGLEKFHFLIGIVGRFHPMKGHKILFQAAEEIFIRNPELVSKVLFVCIGDGNSETINELKGLTEKFNISKNIIWVRATNSIDRLYNALDLLCSPSVFGEGFPNVIAEAMSCGITCLVTDVGDAKAIVGEHGLIVSPNNPKELAENILEAIRNPISSPEAIRKSITIRYSSDKLIERTEEIFLELLKIDS